MFKLFFIMFVNILSSCGMNSPKDVANPSELTIDKAMQSVANGFQGWQNSLDSKHKTGLWPCRVTINLNVTASAQNAESLVIDTNISDVGNIAKLGVKNDFSSSISGVRNNTVSVELYNPTCIPEKTIGFDKPDKLDAVLDALRRNSADQSKNSTGSGGCDEDPRHPGKCLQYIGPNSFPNE